MPCHKIPLWCRHNGVFYFSVVEIVTSSPPGMQLTSLRYNGGVYYRNVTWYPSQYQVGQQAFCFKAVDSSGWDDIFFVIRVLRALSIHQKLSRWGSIGWRLCSIWKIYHASIIDELIMSGIHFWISKFLKTSFSKWPIANARKDSFFGRQSQQTLQVIAEYFPI